jgi:hypothetical protein
LQGYLVYEKVLSILNKTATCVTAPAWEGLCGIMITDTQKQEIGTSLYGEMGNQPVDEAVVFSQTEIRKKDFLIFVLLRNNELLSCYQNAAQRIRGSGQKKLLLSMVERKKQAEQQVLKKLGSSESPVQRSTDSILPSVMQYMLDTDLRPVNTVTDVLQFMLKKEQKELDLFGRLSDLEENFEVKKIFLDHMLVCKEHIGALETDYVPMAFELAMNQNYGFSS